MKSTDKSPAIGIPDSTSLGPISKMRGRTLICLPYLMIGIIAVCTYISAYGMEFLGDDLNHGMHTAEKFPHWYQWPLAIPYQWLTGNGRFGDMIGNVLLAQAPMWLLATLSGLMEGLLYLLAMKMSFPTKKSVLPRLVVLAVIMFTFPWWDSFFLFVCRINYIWTAALTLLTLWVTLFRHQEIKASWCFILIPMALTAGWGHEACGMPTAVGLLVYIYSGNYFGKLPKSNRWILIALIIGGFLSITSPCSYSRLGSARIPDDILPVLLLKSSFIALMLILFLAVACCFGYGRKIIMALCRTPWIVLTVAAISSIVFVAAGGVVGRSGLFSQIYALIAICGLIRKLTGEQRLWKGGMSVGLTSAFLFVIMAAHECGVCAYQIKGNQQLTQCRKLYEASSDGVVYASPIQRNEFPWWTLNKNKACIDNDDTWLIEVYDLRLGNSQKHYRLLPKALQNLDMNKARIANLPSEESIEQTRPAGTSADGRLLRDGVEQTVVEFTAANGEILYYVAPRIIDPGDR